MLQPCRADSAPLSPRPPCAHQGCAPHAEHCCRCVLGAAQTGGAGRVLRLWGACVCMYPAVAPVGAAVCMHSEIVLFGRWWSTACPVWATAAAAGGGDVRSSLRAVVPCATCCLCRNMLHVPTTACLRGVLQNMLHVPTNTYDRVRGVVTLYDRVLGEVVQCRSATTESLLQLWLPCRDGQSQCVVVSVLLCDQVAGVM